MLGHCQQHTLELQQGATDAHEFFVLESGTCDALITPSSGGAAKKVKTYGTGSAFGELALLYAAPRAATVTATAQCKVRARKHAPWCRQHRASAHWCTSAGSMHTRMQSMCIATPRARSTRAGVGG